MTERRELAEPARLAEARDKGVPWRKWGPYLSERQWGTVREDYSDDGDAWSYFPHDQARSRAYRWGEDGLAGFSDDKQRLCFALALWNGNDPILKERLFGLTNGEGNHGEDVKEYYFYLDSTPTHSYMKYLYKYPQRAYPYDDLVATNRGRSRAELEYELLDTGVFADDRYFDVFVEYAKAAPEDVLIRITAANRGPDAADAARPAHPLVPQHVGVVARSAQARACARPRRSGAGGRSRPPTPSSAPRWLHVEGEVPLLFTENETNTQRLFGTPNPRPTSRTASTTTWSTGAGRRSTRRRRDEGRRALRPGGRRGATPPSCASASRTRLRTRRADPFAGFDGTFEARRREADEFYRSITPASATRGRGAR